MAVFVRESARVLADSVSHSRGNSAAWMRGSCVAGSHTGSLTHPRGPLGGDAQSAEAPVDDARGEWNLKTMRDGLPETSPSNRGMKRRQRWRRYEQLRYAEERLRPLVKTRLAGVYWNVYAEFHRLGREILQESAIGAEAMRRDTK